MSTSRSVSLSRRPSVDDVLAAEVRSVGLAAGLAAVGITDTAPFTETRRRLEAQVRSGGHGGMAFTFRNPRRSTEPARLLRDARSLVVGALAYGEPTPDRPDGPIAAVARYAWRDHYARLRSALDDVADVLRDHGHRAVVVADDNALVDRAAAHRAGIAWRGRNGNLLTPGLGSWFVVGSVATDARLPVSAETVPDGCGTCRRCEDGCPTGAIVGDGAIDGRRCLAWLVQRRGVFPRRYRVALGDRLYGCDDCQDVCPPGRRAATAGPAPEPGEPLSHVDVVDLLACDDDSLLRRFGRWYIPDRSPTYLRRNALVVLGNVGRPGDHRQRRALRVAATSAAPLVRSHAVWAAARLGHDDLVAALGDDAAPVVRAEVALAPAVPRVAA